MSLESVGSNYLYSPSILDFVLQKRFTISRLSNESEFTHLLCRFNTHFVQLQNSMITSPLGVEMVVLFVRSRIPGDSAVRPYNYN